MEIKVRFQAEPSQTFEFINGKSDWIDLRASETVEMKTMEFKLIPLGFAMELPEGYEAHILPRSSTFKNFGIIQTNSMGIIDNSYKGDEDYWFFPAVAFRDTKIEKGDRICQFRIVETMDKVFFKVVEQLDNENREGFGSSGIR